MSAFHTYRPGLVPYATGLALQERFLVQRRPDDTDLLILLRHPAVVTLGRRSGADSLRLPSEQLLQRFNIETFHVGRGGETTFHGPDQLVGYPLVDLNSLGRDLHRFVFLLEQTLLDTLLSFGVEGERIKGRTGVWVKGEKIASIGIGVRHWISWHGFGLNVGSGLEGFQHIVPCGMPDVSMTSLAHQLQQDVSMPEVEEKVIAHFGRNFDTRYLGEYAPSWTTQT